MLGQTAPWLFRCSSLPSVSTALFYLGIGWLALFLCSRLFVEQSDCCYLNRVGAAVLSVVEISFLWVVLELVLAHQSSQWLSCFYPG